MSNFFPDTIFQQTTTVAPTPTEREWVRLELLNADVSIDPSGIVTVDSEDGTGTTVTVAAGTTTNFPAVAGTFFFELVDSSGNAISGTDYFDAKLYVEVVTAPATDSDVWITAGFFNSATATSGLYGGLVWNSASGQYVRAGNTAANTDTALNAINRHFITEGTVLNGSLRYLQCAALDASKAQTNNVSSRGGTSNFAATPNYIGISLGRTSTSGSSETVKIRAYVLEIRKAASLP